MKKIKNSIFEQKIESAMGSPEFEKELDLVVTSIKNLAKSAPNEATIATNFELKLYGFLKQWINVEFEAVKEESIETAIHINKGRIDSRIGALVIEYKQKKKLTSEQDQKKAVEQLKNYVINLPEDFKRGAVGVITDGWLIKFISLEDEEKFSETPFEELNTSHLLRVIRGILTLQKKALTPENLIAGFCMGNLGPAKKLSLALYDALSNHPTGRSQMLFKEWQGIFKLAHDDQSKQAAIEERRMALGEALGIKITKGDNETEYKALYAIQTSYAIIVKAIAFKVLSSIRFSGGNTHFSDLAGSDYLALRTHLDRLESGAIFRSEGFGNLLEGDFFAWYCTVDQWDDSIAEAVKNVFVILSEYENHHMFDGGRVQDLFKGLYMSIIPDKVRHSLGEFYTPPWLAEHTIREAISLADANNKAWTALDPCCGSGTFVTVLIRLILEMSSEKDRVEKLKDVLSRVKGIDLNPLAVLTTRINYFINLSHLIGREDYFDVPVYLGDASYVPAPEKIGNVKCWSYVIGTEKGPLKILMPASALHNMLAFSKTMTQLETFIENENEDAVSKALFEVIDPIDLTNEVQGEIRELAKRLVDLQKNKWNGIWARIICNFLSTANLGRFDIVVGNPPWIDWKNLPQGYRERITGLCISRKLFSGDGITGGINLNICALISNVASQNWLKSDGVLGFLMPENLIFQQSYEGFRNFYLDDGYKLYFQKFVDWTSSGHPFSPVQHRFLSYFIGSKKQNYLEGVKVDRYIKRANNKTQHIYPLKDYANTPRFSSVQHIFDQEHAVAITASEKNSAFSYAKDAFEGSAFAKIAGTCSYLGREGVEVFPQELFLLTVDKTMPLNSSKVYLKNYQNTRSKHKIPAGTFLLETKYLYPLIKGVDIERFHISQSEYVVPFPYENMSRSPIPSQDLALKAPELMRYFNSNRVYFDAQTSYNDKIIGEKHRNEFYALARVGIYSYGDFFVAFRDNTKWQAAVVSRLPVPWDDEPKRPIFQNHAVSISQRADGAFITEDEAHFICAIFNAPIVANFLLKSSDSRSFKIRPPIEVPIFDPENGHHLKLVKLSREAHSSYQDCAKIEAIDMALDAAYLAILS
jgi:hypothetical protein